MSDGRLIGRFKRILGLKDDAEVHAHAAVRPAGVTDGGAPDSVSASDFLRRLARLEGEQRNVLSGNVHLVGLQRIREKLGSDWPRNAERAQTVANHCLRRALSADDIYVRYDELRFLIVFSNLGRDQAQIKCLRIADEIAQRLLGENFDSSASQVETGVFETDGSIVFSALNKEALVARLAGSDATVVAAEAPPGSVDAAPTQTSSVMPTPPVADFSMARIDKAKALASIQIEYRPMWSLKQQAITTYFAAPTAISVFGRKLQGDEVLREYASIVNVVEYDIFVTRRVLAGMAGAISQGLRMMLCWPINFETIATRQSRHDYLAICQEIPEAIRQLLVFEVNQLPVGVPQSRLVEVVTNLQPFCRAVFIRVAAGFRKGAIAAASGAVAAGFALPSGGDEDDKIRMINEFAEQCSKFGLRSYVRGVPNRAQVLAALAAGIDYVDGPAVAHPADLPGAMRRFDIKEIYQ